MFCQACGMEVASTYKFCPKCGGKDFSAQLQNSSWIPPTTTHPLPVQPANPSFSMGANYAGFGKRLGAYTLDYLIVLVGVVVISGVLGAFLSPMADEDNVELIAVVVGYLVAIIATWLYSAILESGPHQATFGKCWLGCKVTDEQGRRISFGKATGRYFAKILSGMIMLIGFLMVLWTEKRQGLHDKIAGTYVVHAGGR